MIARRFHGLFRRMTAFVAAVLVASGISYAAVKDWSTVPSSNGSILSGITLDGAVMTVPQIDDAFRGMAAQIASQLGKTGFKGADLASATTTDLSTATGWYVHITGTTTITGLGTVDAGQVFILEFDGALTLTHNATSLILQGSENITTAAGGVAVVVSEGSGNWRLISYTPPGAFTFTPTVQFGGASVGVVYASQLGKAVKIGDVIFFTATVTLTNNGSSAGELTIDLGTLPNVAASHTSAAAISDYSGFTGLTGSLFGEIMHSDNVVQIQQHGSTGVGLVQDTNTTNNMTITIAGHYFY